MTLESLVENINEIGEDLVIFQEKELSMNSDVVLFNQDDDYSIERIKNNIRYVYFMEVFIAKDFINDLVNSLQTKPSTKDIALRLLEYAINDA